MTNKKNDVPALRLGTPAASGSDAPGDFGYIDLDTPEGRRRWTFTNDEAEDLILRLRQAQLAILEQRKKAGKPLYPSTFIASADRIEMFTVPIDRCVLLRAHLENGLVQDVLIGNAHLPPVIEFLHGAAEKFSAKPGD